MRGVNDRVFVKAFEEATVHVAGLSRVHTVVWACDRWLIVEQSVMRRNRSGYEWPEVDAETSFHELQITGYLDAATARASIKFHDDKVREAFVPDEEACAEDEGLGPSYEPSAGYDATLGRGGS